MNIIHSYPLTIWGRRASRLVRTNSLGLGTLGTFRRPPSLGPLAEATFVFGLPGLPTLA